MPDDITLDKSFECSIRVRTTAMKVHKNFFGFIKVSQSKIPIWFNLWPLITFVSKNTASNITL